MARLTIAQQSARMRALDALRRQRRLTAEEQAEADQLAHCQYMREWRQQRVERWGRYQTARKIGAAA